MFDYWSLLIILVNTVVLSILYRNILKGVKPECINAIWRLNGWLNFINFLSRDYLLLLLINRALLLCYSQMSLSTWIIILIASQVIGDIFIIRKYRVLAKKNKEVPENA